MSHVNYHDCDGCKKQMDDELAKHPIVLAIYNPEKKGHKAARSLMEYLYGDGDNEAGEYDKFEFCSAACILLAVRAQALLEA